MILLSVLITHCARDFRAQCQKAREGELMYAIKFCNVHAIEMIYY